MDQLLQWIDYPIKFAHYVRLPEANGINTYQLLQDGNHPISRQEFFRRRVMPCLRPLGLRHTDPDEAAWLKPSFNPLEL